MKILKFHEYINESNVDTNFIKWFGNSKVTNINGKPLVVYHGTRGEPFDTFNDFTYFTEDFFNADGYANGETVYEVYLSIQNPIIIDCKDKKWDKLETPYGTSTREIVSNIDTTKYDGIIFTNIKDAWFDDADYQNASTVYVNFSPNQVKSVDNDGTWDIDDNNIFS